MAKLSLVSHTIDRSLWLRISCLSACCGCLLQTIANFRLTVILCMTRRFKGGFNYESHRPLTITTFSIFANVVSFFFRRDWLSDESALPIMNLLPRLFHCER